MSRRPIRPSVDESPDDGPGEVDLVAPDDFREAMSWWASGVCIVAARDEEGTVHATTVGSFGAVSAEPPRVFFSLGPGAQVLPFLPEDAAFVVNLLSADQRRLATAYTDAYPVGPSPFPEEGPPEIDGVQALLRCSVDETFEVGSSRIVVGRVEAARAGDGDGPLVHYRRSYRRLAPD